MASFDLSNLASTLAATSSTLQTEADASLYPEAFPAFKKLELTVEDIPTEILISKFSNTYFFLITQINKVGTMIHAYSEKKSNLNNTFFSVDSEEGEKEGGEEPSQPVNPLRFITKILIGKRDDPLLEIYARQLLENMNKVYELKEIYVGISLKEEGRSRESFLQIVNAILENVTSL